MMKHRERIIHNIHQTGILKAILLCICFLFLPSLSIASEKKEVCSFTVPEWGKLWEKAHSGDCNAMYALLSNYWQLGLEQIISHEIRDKSKAEVEQLVRAAQSGSADACYLLAEYFLHVNIDFVKSKSYLEKGAELGNAECMMEVACGMLFNQLVFKNEKQIRDLFLRAAKAGKSDAYAALALMYLWLGEHGMNKNIAWEQCEQYLRKADEADSAMAWSVKGDMYITGKGRTYNYKEAIKCYQIGAQKGDSKAQYVYGKYCIGNPTTVSEGIKLLHESAAQFHTGSISILGFIYLNGFEVPQDIQKGLLFIQYAAYNGEETAQFQLGQLLYEGKFIAQNKELGLEWIQKAASQGCQPAIQYLKQLIKP